MIADFQTPFNAGSLRLRMKIAAQSEVTEDQIEELLDSPRLRSRIIAVVLSTLSETAYSSRLMDMISGSPSLFSLSIEQNQDKDVWWKLELSSDLHRRLPSEIHDVVSSSMVETDRRWMVRIVDKIGKALLSKTEFNQVQSHTRSRIMAKQSHEAHATIVMVLMHALAVEMEASIPPSALARFQLIAPGAPNPVLSLDMDKVRPAFQAGSRTALAI